MARRLAGVEVPGGVGGLANDGGPVWGGVAVEGVGDEARPGAAEEWGAFGEAGGGAEELEEGTVGKVGEFGVDDFVVDLVAGVQTLEADGITVEAKAADEGIDGVELGMAEEADPELEVSGNAARSVQMASGLLPEGAAPEGGFLLDIAIGASEEAEAGPARGQIDGANGAVFMESGGSAGDPIDLGEVAKDGADHGEAAGVEHIGGGDPAHDFAGGAGETFVEGVVHAVVRFGDPAGELGLVFTDDVEGAVGGTAVDDEVFEIGVVLREDGLDGLFD